MAWHDRGIWHGMGMVWQGMSMKGYGIGMTWHGSPYIL